MSGDELARRRAEVEAERTYRKLPQYAWAAYRESSPPEWPDDPGHAEFVIMDALTQEGIAAWHGDAVSCVQQIVRAYAKQAESTAAWLAEADAVADYYSVPLHRRPVYKLPPVTLDANEAARLLSEALARHRARRTRDNVAANPPDGRPK